MYVLTERELLAHNIKSANGDGSAHHGACIDRSSDRHDCFVVNATSRTERDTRINTCKPNGVHVMNVNDAGSIKHKHRSISNAVDESLRWLMNASANTVMFRMLDGARSINVCKL